MNQQQNTMQTTDNEMYLQNGMDIIISDNESNISIQENNITNDDLLDAINLITSHEDTPVAVDYVIDRQPSQEIEHHEYIDIQQNLEQVFNIVSDDERNEESDDETNAISEQNSSDDDIDEDLHAVQLLQKQLREGTTNYIGLAVISEHMIFKGRYYQEMENFTQAIEQYKMALEISPYSDRRQEYASLLEEVGLNELAKKHYIIAIEQHEDIMAMFGLAYLYKNELNSLEKYNVIHNIKTKESNDQIKETTQLMLKYFAMASEKGDNEALEMLCALSYGKDTVMFAQAYKNILRDPSSHNLWPIYAYEDEEDKSEFSNFIQTTTILDIMHTLKNTDTSLLNDKERAIVRECIAIIETQDSVITYNNKIALFTRLNHFTECHICYEDQKLNINLHCGHCVCSDCYRHLVKSPCPFCRTKSPYGIIE